MPTINNKGFAHILVLLVLLIGLGVGVFLVTHPTVFKPKADELSSSTPLIPVSHLRCTTFYDWSFVSPQAANEYLQRTLPKMKQNGFNCVYYILDWNGLNPVAFLRTARGME